MINEDVSETLLAHGLDIIFKEISRYVKIMTNFKGIDWASYVKTRTSEDKERMADLLDESVSELEGESAEVDKAEKQRQRVKAHLKQIDRLYSQAFLKRLLRIVEIFTSIQARS